MLSSVDARELRERLRQDGGATLVLDSGQRLFFVLSRNLGLDERGMLVAFEGGGTLFWKLDRPLNAFRLMKAGISMTIAEELSHILNLIILAPEEQHNDQTTPKRLTQMAAHPARKEEHEQPDDTHPCPDRPR